MKRPVFELSKESFSFVCLYHHELDNYGTTNYSLFNLPADFPSEILGFEITPELQRNLIEHMELELGIKNNKGYHIYLFYKQPFILLSTHHVNDVSKKVPDRLLLEDEVRTFLSPALNNEPSDSKSKRIVRPTGTDSEQSKLSP